MEERHSPRRGPAQGVALALSRASPRECPTDNQDFPKDDGIMAAARETGGTTMWPVLSQRWKRTKRHLYALLDEHCKARWSYYMGRLVFRRGEAPNAMPSASLICSLIDMHPTLVRPRALNEVIHQLLLAVASCRSVQSTCYRQTTLAVDAGGGRSPTPSPYCW